MQAHLVTVKEVIIRTALVSEKPQLEALQWRASLNNPGDREALLANPDAIAIPDEQIPGELMSDDAIVGFAAILNSCRGKPAC
jgi:hypothetical protein